MREQRHFSRRLWLGVCCFALLCVLSCLVALSASAEGETLTVSLPAGNTVSYGDAFVVTATLSGVTEPQGTVSFFYDGEPLGTAALSGGVATVSVLPKQLTVADSGCEITAVYTDETLTVNGAAEAPLTVAKRQVSLANFSIKDKIYDGTKNAFYEWDNTFSGLLAGDTMTVEIDCHFTARFAGENVAVVVELDYGVGADHANYELVNPTGVTATISPRPLTVSGLSATTRAYDGTIAVTLTGGELVGILAGEESYVTATMPTAGTAASANAGTRAVSFTAIKLKGSESGNYSLTQPEVSVVIERATLTLTVDKVVIDKGQPLPALTLSVTGFVNGENATSLTGFTLPQASATDTVNTLDMALTSFAVTCTEGVPTDNYEFDFPETAAIEIKSVSVTADDYTTDLDVALWQKGNITLSPAGEYTAVSTDAATWQTALTLGAEGENTQTFYLKKDDGTITEAGSVSYKIDTVAPTGTLSIGETDVAAETKTPHYFHLNGTTVTLSGSDALSGVKTVVYAVADLNETPDDADFTVGNTCVIGEKRVVVVYLRVTDNAGNVTELHTDGIVTYLNSTAEDTETSFERLSGLDATASLNLNGNTVAGLSLGDTAITATDYTVGTDGTVTLKAAFLATVAKGDYTVTVTYAPMGETYVTGDLPATTTFTLHVTLRDPVAADFSMTPDAVTYDGTAKPVTVTGKPGMGTITVYYTLADLSLTTEAPVTVGTYTVTIAVTSGTDYAANGEIVLGSIRIDKAGQPVPATATAHDCTTLQNNDGSISGLSAAMEYAVAGAETFTPVAGTELTGLADGVYRVRYAADDNHVAGTVLTLTVRHYGGFAEDDPTVTYDAAADALVGVREREQYRFAGGEWQPVPASFAGMVTGPCVLEFYLPGDGVYTLDSGVVTVTVTRGVLPLPVATDETLFIACDGTVSGVDATMEYRLAGETRWIPITGTTVTGLAPGSYEVRVRSEGCVLAGDIATFAIAAAPEFVPRDLSAAGDVRVALTGMFTADGVLTVTDLKGTGGEGAVRSLSVIDTRVTEVVALYEIDYLGRTDGELTLTLGIDEAYNEETLTVYHEKADGTVETFTVLCENGAVTLTVTELSPFLVTIPMTTPYGVGSHAWIWLLVVIVALFVGLVVFMEIRTRRKKH